MLQSVLRELGQDIKVDGIIGPKTEKALENALSNYGEGDILNRLSSLQLARYQSLPSYETNKGGWNNRAAWIPDFPTPQVGLPPQFAMENIGNIDPQRMPPQQQMPLQQLNKQYPFATRQMLEDYHLSGLRADSPQQPHQISNYSSSSFSLQISFDL